MFFEKLYFELLHYILSCLKMYPAKAKKIKQKKDDT